MDFFICFKFLLFQHFCLRTELEPSILPLSDSSLSPLSFHPFDRREERGRDEDDEDRRDDREGHDDDASTTTCNVYVGQLSHKTDEDALLELFSRYGKVG